MAEVPAQLQGDDRGPHETAPPPVEAGASPPVVDVWMRTAPRYRVRAVVLLWLNFLLFCGLCIFALWLHRGVLFEFTLESYFAPARFWNSQSPNLSDFIRYPISVVQNPAHGVVLGLVLASIVAVPLLIAMLYRFPYSLPFIAAVAVFAHMPWMAITLTASCILASVKPFRMNFRFGSALVGLLPVVMYIYLAGGGAEMLEDVSPTERLLLTAPWVLAILAATVMVATVLIISRIVNYRPGAVAPVVAVMFATPVVLFHTKVGADELAYRVLESECGPRSARFQPVQDVEPEVRQLLARFASDPESVRRFWPDMLGALGGEPGPMNRALRNHLLVGFLGDRAWAYEECKRFIVDYPRSRYIPNVLFVQGWVLDTRLATRGDAEPLRTRELYSDFPHVQSESVWTALLHEHPDSPLAIAAGVRLAQIRLRRATTDAALAALDAALGAATRRAAALPTTRPASFLRPLVEAPEQSLAFEPAPYIVEARRLRELVGSNRGDPAHGDAPLAALASLDPRLPEYENELRSAARRYSASLMDDNFRVRLAMASPSADVRMEELKQLVDQLADGDALPEAMFQLAELEIQRAPHDGRDLREQGVRRLRRLVERFPDSCWAIEAADRLTSVAPRPEARVEP